MRSLSIRYKFLAVIVATSISVVMAYLALATKLFENDKEAYIYDSNASLVASVSAEIASTLDGVGRTLRTAATLYADPTTGAQTLGLVKDLFDGSADLVHLAVYGLGADAPKKPRVALAKSDFLDMYGLDAGRLDEIDRAALPALAELAASGLYVHNSSLPGGVPILSVGIALPAKDGSRVVAVASLRQDQLLKIFSRSEVFETFLIDGAGNLLVHRDVARVADKENVADPTFAKEVLNNPIKTGAKEFTVSKGDRRIVAYSKLDLAGLVVVSEISRDTAFAASRRLVQKSALFAVALLGAALLISMLFSKTLTRPLARLFQATRQISAGNFNVRVDVKSGDEIGALSTSFNAMAGEIVTLMGQVRDKARMEKELETARLVQENLFPVADVRMENCEISGFYTPASECGGDWWGHFSVDGRLVLLVGDATGHGVPAALITAAAQSCCTTIQQIHKRTPSMQLSSASLMSDLNAAIFHAAKGGMNMTFFIAIVDFRTGQLTYCNASHELPVIAHAAGDGAETADASVTMLDGDPDPSLGASLDSTYRDHAATLGAGDSLVFYTDGLVEVRNADDKEWGERRFLKAIKAGAASAASALRDRIMAEARSYFGQRPLDDDITLIVVRRT